MPCPACRAERALREYKIAGNSVRCPICLQTMKLSRFLCDPATARQHRVKIMSETLAIANLPRKRAVGWLLAALVPTTVAAILYLLDLYDVSALLNLGFMALVFVAAAIPSFRGSMRVEVIGLGLLAQAPGLLDTDTEVIHLDKVESVFVAYVNDSGSRATLGVVEAREQAVRFGSQLAAGQRLVLAGFMVEAAERIRTTERPVTL